MAKISTLTDLFDTQDYGKWNWGSAGVSVSSGKAHFNAVNYGGAYATTTVTYDVTNSSIVFKLDAVPSTANMDGPFFVMQLQDDNPDPYTGNRLAWYYDPTGAGTGNLKPRTISSAVTGSVISDGTAVAWTGTAIYLRILDDGTNIVWASSPDGTTWTTRRTLARPAGYVLTAMYATLFGTNNGAETGSFDIDSVNNVSTGGGGGGGGTGTLTTLTDTFDTKDTSKWTWYGPASASGGALIIPSAGWGNTPSGVQSTATTNLTNAGLVFEVVPTLPAPVDEALLELGFSSTAIDGTENRALFSFYGTNTNAEIKYRVGGVTTIAPGLVPLQRFMRVRHSGSSLIWDSSPDGSAWGTAVTIATPFTVSALYVWALVKGNSTGTYQIAAVNPGVAPAPTPPAGVPSIGTTPGTRQVTLTWGTPSNGGSPILAYVLTRSGGDLPPVSLAVGPTVNSNVFQGLTPNVQYFFSVYATNAIGNGAQTGMSGTPNSGTPINVPGPPTSVVATAGNSTAVVSWTAPSITNGTILGYTVYDQNDFVRGEVVGTGTTTGISGLVNGMQYTFRVSAYNATGDSVLSAPSNVVTPLAVEVFEDLYKRSTLGAASNNHATLETQIGQALQPVVHYVHLADTPASLRSKIEAAALRGRWCLFMISTAGCNSADICNGGYDLELEAWGAAFTAVDVPVFVAPVYEANDLKHPWSPYYNETSPGYVEADAALTTGTAQYKKVFDKIARKLRLSAPKSRSVWSISVEPQEAAGANDLADYYPGVIADVLMMKGFNYGVGPNQSGGNTEWKTAEEIFDDAYTTVAALHASKPIWIYTASHEPSTVYSPAGPNFPAGAVTPIDTTHSKGTWIHDLLYATTWGRVTSVSFYSISDTRNWDLNSSTASLNAVRSTIDSSWGLTEVTQDYLGDYVRDSTVKFANWLRSGPTPAPRTNEYQRPDRNVAGGVQGSLVFGLPYSPGQKSLVNIPTTDMAAWNRVHGLLLRQCARNGILGSAFASGALSVSDPVLMYPGTIVNGRTTLPATGNAQPGQKMQIEGGMTAPSGGSVPTTVPLPDTSLPTILSGQYTDPTTQIAVAWTPLTTAQLGGLTLSGYRFSYLTTDAREPDKTYVSATYPVTNAPQPFVFTGLIPGVEYDVSVEAVMTNGQSGKTTKKKPTTPTTATQPPSAPTNVQATNLTTTTMGLSWGVPVSTGSSAVLGYYVSWGGWTSPRITQLNTDTAFPPPGLTGFVANTTYQIDVWAENTQGMGPHNVFTVKTPAEVGTEPGTPNPTLQGMAPRFVGGYLPQWLHNPIQLATYSTNHNFLLPFAAVNNGNGAFAWTSQVPTGIATCRARGQRVILSCGGAGQHFNFTTRTHSQNFVNSIKAINTQWGGTLTNPAFDGVDFNTFEADAVRVPAEYVWMGQELKRVFGSNFIVHAPPAPWNQLDKDLARQCLAAGAWDFVTPQYYDGGLATFNGITSTTNGSGVTPWVNDVAGGDASKIAVGFGLHLSNGNDTQYMSWQEIQRTWDTIEARHPTIRGGWIWQVDADVNLGNPFATNVAPDIKNPG